MKKILAMAAVATTMLSFPTSAFAFDKDSHPGATAYTRGILLAKSLVQAPLWVVGDTFDQAAELSSAHDNALLVVPGAVMGMGLGLADAAASQVDAVRGVDSSYLTKNPILSYTK